MASDPGAPSVSGSVLAELRAIDPGLYAVWWNLRRIPTTGEIVLGPGDQPFREPRWHIFLEKAAEQHYLFTVRDDRGEYRPLDSRVPRQIRSDIARNMSQQEMSDFLDRCAENAREAKEREEAQKADDFRKANKGLVQDILEDPSRMEAPPSQRDATIYSYDGQPLRTTGRNVIPHTNRELGIESPWPDPSEEAK